MPTNAERGQAKNYIDVLVLIQVVVDGPYKRLVLAAIDSETFSSIII